MKTIMPPRSVRLHFLGGLSLAVLAGCVSPLPPQVIVVGDVTEAGRGLTPPDAQHPVYYLPAVAGYKEHGAIMAGEKPPVKNDVLHTFAVELAKQNYLVMDAGHPPDQLLVFWWGSMNPEIDEAIAPSSSDDSSETVPLPDQVFFNEREMLALVGSYKTGSLPLWKRNELQTAARDNRYFVILMAFDFAAARQHQKKLLWMAKMSTESVRTDLTTVIPALIASGGPVFGRDTPPSRVDSGKALKEGRVILAPVEVKDYLPTEKK